LPAGSYAATTLIPVTEKSPQLLKGRFDLQAQALLTERTQFKGTREDYRFYFTDPTYNPFDWSSPTNALNLIASARSQFELATALNFIGSTSFFYIQNRNFLKKYSRKNRHRKDDPNALLEPAILAPQLYDLVSVLTAAVSSPYLTKQQPGGQRFDADPRRDRALDSASGYLDRDNAAEDFVRLMMDFMNLGKNVLRKDWVQFFARRLLSRPFLSPRVLTLIADLHGDHLIELQASDFQRLISLSPEIQGPPRPRVNSLLAIIKALQDNHDAFALSERLDILTEAMVKDREISPKGEFTNKIYEEIYQSEVIALAKEPYKTFFRAKFIQAVTKRSVLAKANQLGY
jgi:hypothetical protein